MQVADENIARMECGPDQGGVAGNGHAAQLFQDDLDVDHTTRGLVAAILICMVCWAALGYYLLS